MKPLRTLRARLLTAFVAVVMPPLLLLALAVNLLLARSFDASTHERLTRALGAVKAEVERQRRHARDAVQQVATVDLPALQSRNEQGDAGIATALAKARDLPALEIVDRDGRVISSRHWPAGFKLADRDELFPGDDSLRVEQVADNYGAVRRLAVMAQSPAEWRGRLVVVRGGPLLDDAFCRDLSNLAGVEVGVRDQKRGRWLAATGPLASWDAPAFAAGGSYPEPRPGEIVLSGRGYRWAAAPLHPDLWLVAAAPRSALDEVQGSVRRLAFGLAVGALLLALLAAFVLSGRIARPVGALAASARSLAAGERPAAVPGASGEIGELSRAFSDLAEQLHTSRERLLQAERVAAWREMARRLAHELKNPIFPIQLSIETLRRALAQDESDAGRFGALFRESSDTILDELRALRSIVDEFSDFARMPQPRLNPTDVNDVAAHVLDLYRARAGGVLIESALQPDLPPVSGDHDLLARALGNLVGNALDAMPEGGTLRVTTSVQDGAVALEVSDTGPGLTEEQRTRLFTPYFTTKKGGTGLGLAIVQGIVSDHGGRIQVRSEPGRGTTFTLLLPRPDTRTTAAPPGGP